MILPAVFLRALSVKIQVVNNPKYLLLLDPREESLSLQETALRTFYGGEVMSLKNSNEALELFKSKGHPEMLIMDSEIMQGFYPHIQNANFNFPIIATTLNKAKSQSDFPSVTAMIEKPINATSFTHLVKSLTSTWTAPFRLDDLT